MQGGSNGFQSPLQIGRFWRIGAILAVHHGSQEVALAHELLIVMDQGLERGRLLAIALGHAIIFRNRLLLNQGFQSANPPGQPLQALGCCHRGSVRKWLLPGRAGEGTRAGIRSRPLHAGHGDAEQPRGFAAHELVVGAQLVFDAVEVVAPAIEQVGGDLPQGAGVIKSRVRHYFSPGFTPDFSGKPVSAPTDRIRSVDRRC